MANPAPQTAFDKIFRFSIVFLVVYLALSLIIPKPDPTEVTHGEVTIKSLDKNYAQGQLVTLTAENKSIDAVDATVVVEARQNGEWVVLPLPSTTYTLNPNQKEVITYENENTEFLGQTGKYRAIIKNTNGEFLAENDFEVSQPGIFRTIWRTIFFKPIYNTLIVLVEFSQSYLFIAVILLTLIIKLILLVPSKKGIIAQQKMQKVQPELNKLKEKYKSDPQKQAQEMMALWKKHKVNPGSAFLPTLIQFPVLIALFFVVKDGLLPHNTFMLYPLPFLQNFDFLQINFDFLWMSLDTPDPYIILPVIVGALQFWQMKSMQAKQAKGKDEKAEKTTQENVMTMMIYILPFIIVIFSVTLPSAVVLYWGVSTVFAIVQQRLLQKKGDDSSGKKGKKKDDKVVDVEVVEEKPKKVRIKA